MSEVSVYRRRKINLANDGKKTTTNKPKVKAINILTKKIHIYVYRFIIHTFMLLVYNLTVNIACGNISNGIA